MVDKPMVFHDKNKRWSVLAYEPCGAESAGAAASGLAYARLVGGDMIRNIRIV